MKYIALCLIVLTFFSCKKEEPVTPASSYNEGGISQSIYFTGILSDSTTGQPLPNIKVTLSHDSYAFFSSCTTDVNGRFKVYTYWSIDGKYNIQKLSHAYIFVDWQQAYFGGLTVNGITSIPNGTTVSNCNFSVNKSAIIKTRVKDNSVSGTPSILNDFRMTKAYYSSGYAYLDRYVAILPINLSTHIDTIIYRYAIPYDNNKKITLMINDTIITTLPGDTSYVDFEIN